MTQRPAILITAQHLGPLGAFLESTYEIYRLWEGLPEESASAIQAVITAGEYPLGRDLLQKLPSLSLIACFTAGYEGIDLDWCRTHNIAVSHAPNVNHEDVADHALGLILAARRNIVSGDRLIREGRWTPDLRILSSSLRGKKLGIVGLGAIGEAIANRAAAFGLQPQWWGPRPKNTPIPRIDSLLEIAKQSDILVITARADETNQGMIGRNIIEAIGSQGLLVNVSRGHLIDEDALIAALKSGTLGSAALDVFETEPTPAQRWLDVPNLVITPHTGGATTESVQGMLMLLMQNLTAHFSGQPIITPINA